VAAATQELIALALVALVAGYALWRRINKPKDTGCKSCKSNPSNAADDEQTTTAQETTLRFMPRPGSKR
jgi:hypothetical protein